MYVYALYNRQCDRIYIGQTQNLDKRIIEHNQKVGNHYTAKYQGEWELIYSESIVTRSEAIKREKQLKSFRGREFIRGLIV